jgi:hypothetical protein
MTSLQEFSIFPNSAEGLKIASCRGFSMRIGGVLADPRE